MVNSDWEGPWVTADHAYEVVARGIPKGDKLFSGISEYDDYLSYVRKKEGYEPGDTLSLIAPFLIAFDLSNDFLIRVAEANANFIKGSIMAIKTLSNLGYTLNIISTSYCQYVHYTTRLAGISSNNVRCTRFPITEYSGTVDEKDKIFVKRKVEDIVKLPKLGVSARSTEKDLPKAALEAVKELDKFFWEDLPQTTYKRVLEEVKPLGGNRKFGALMKFLEEEGKELHESETIGDSITDWVMLKNTKDAGGLAVSFNGNDYAVSNANVAIISDNCMIIPVIVDLFRRSGIEGVKEITSDWSYETLKKASQANKIGDSLFKYFVEYSGSRFVVPEVAWIDEDSLQAITEKSKKMRKDVRGVAIGSLG
jgi:energy-converting hydrogenase A subunit R